MISTVPVPTTIAALARQIAKWAVDHEQYMVDRLGERGFIRFNTDEEVALLADIENAKYGLALIADALEQDDVAGLEEVLRDAAAGRVEGVDGNQ